MRSSLGAVGEDEDAESVEEAVGEAALVDGAVGQLHLTVAVPLSGLTPVAHVAAAVRVRKRAELACQPSHNAYIDGGRLRRRCGLRGLELHTSYREQWHVLLTSNLQKDDLF